MSRSRMYSGDEALELNEEEGGNHSVDFVRMQDMVHEMLEIVGGRS